MCVNPRTKIAAFLCAALLSLLGAPNPFAHGAAPSATDYPRKPLRILVGFAPGGPTDLVARRIAQKLSESLGQPVVVENRAGANGIIASEIVAKAPADGYTLFLVSSAHTINPSVYKLSFDPVNDFAPMTRVAFGPYLLVVHPSVRAQSVQELITLAKSKPGQLTFASGGTGTGTQLAVEMLKSMASIDMLHVPYKGGGPAMMDMLAGNVSLMINDALTTLPHVRSGKFRALAVTSATRSSAFPEIPTIAESGLPGFEVVGWYGVVAPAGTPSPIIDQLHGEISRIMHTPETREWLAGLGAEPFVAPPAEFATFIQAEIAKWAKLIKYANIKVN